MHLQPLQQHHVARRVGAQQQQQRWVRALPFHLPGQSSSSSRKPTDQQQQQQPTPAPAVTQQVEPFDPPAPSSVAVSSSLKFAKHLANVSNGCAPPMIRFESLGWLLFESKRLQASLLGPNPQQAAASSWLSSAQGVQLLEQIYLIGAAIAELGTADGLQPLSSSNGSRAIVSLDYSRLLERYLQQHGNLLSEGFWSQLHAYDDLQVRLFGCWGAFRCLLGFGQRQSVWGGGISGCGVRDSCEQLCCAVQLACMHVRFCASFVLTCVPAVPSALYYSACAGAGDPRCHSS